MRRHPARPRAGRAGKLRRGRSRRCRNRPRSPRNARHAPSAVEIACTIPSRRTCAIVTTRCPPVDRIAVHRRRIGEGRQPDLGDIAPRQAVLAQRAHRIAIAEPARVSRRSKCASSVISPTSLERQPKRHARAGRVTALLPPTTSVSRVPRDARRARRRGSARSLPRCVMPSIATSPWSATRARQLAPGLDVVAPDPPQRRAQQRRGKVAPPRRDRSQRRAAPRPARPVHRRRLGDDQVGQIGPAHALDASTAPAQCHAQGTGMWDRLLTDCHVATMVAAPGNPLGHR